LQAPVKMYAPPGSLSSSRPASLTAELPDPGAIARQKDTNMRMLDQQLQQSITVLVSTAVRDAQ
ncbi:unnamed protein product, partial [Polarella glacialis]